MNWWIVLFVLLIFLIIYIAYGIWEVTYFKRRGIKYVPPPFPPLLGNIIAFMLQKKHFTEEICKIYNYHPDQKYIGFMQFNKPSIAIRDLEIIKQVTIKDFDHFLNRLMTVDETLDSLFANSLFSLKDDKWKDMRATLSPTFTSSKMKGMLILIDEIGKQTVEYFNKIMNNPEYRERGLLEIELKDTFTRYTNDVIATSAFGIRVNSLDDRENDFYKMGKNVSNFTGWRFFKMILHSSFPIFFKLLNLEMFEENIKRFFKCLILDTMSNRERLGTFRPDMIQLLMEARKGSLKYEAAQNENDDAGFATVQESTIGRRIVKRKWTDNEIVAQTLAFFLGGFDSVSTLLCFLTYEITMNPDVQKKLQEEIDDLIDVKGENINYNNLMTMKYLDMVVTETLRKWPPAFAIDRQCIKQYTFSTPDDSSTIRYEMKPGEGIWIPIYAIHHDSQYYPNPHKFDPERFSEENKPNLNPNAYLPFGIGPRNCIGSRFALMEAKLIIVNILLNFDLVPTAKTENPIKLSNQSFSLVAENGFWIGLMPRNK